MNRSFIPTLLATLLFTLLSITLSAASHTWLGADSPIGDQFQNVANWSSMPSTTPNAQNDLIFGASENYAPVPDIELSFRSITITEEAEESYFFANSALLSAYSTGNAHNVISNKSKHTVTFANDFALYTYIRSQYNDLLGETTFHTGYGDIIWSGSNMTATAKNVLVKSGPRNLTLAGDQSGYDNGSEIVAGINYILGYGGTVTLDFDAGFKAREDLGFAAANNGDTGSGTALQIVGSSSLVEKTVFALNHYRMDLSTSTNPNRGKANKIIVDSNGGMGTDLIINSILLDENLYPTGTEFNDSAAYNYTLNIQLVGQSTLKAPAELVPNNRSAKITVTTSGGLTGTLTGFATRDDDGYIIRNDSLTPLPAVVNSNITANTAYRLVGNAEFSRTNANNLTNIYNLVLSADTIGQGGSLTFVSNPTYNHIGINGLLMEEGVGDYHIAVPITKGDRFIHQYSTTGILYLDAGIDSTFTKTGPGTMVISASAINGGVGGISLQEGTTIINSDFATVGNTGYAGDNSRSTGIFVWGSAGYTSTLAGAGTLGAGTYDANKWLHVRIGADGILDGTAQYLDSSNNQKSFTIYGDLNFVSEYSTYKVDLHEDNGTPLHIAAAATNPASNILFLNGNLELTLNYKPKFNEIFVLLTWQSGYNRVGEFLTVNGEHFFGDDNNEFFLEFNGVSYLTTIHYGSDSIYLTTIPEPSTIVLLFGMALTSMVWFRHRTK
jgi:hypothetical protein